MKYRIHIYGTCRRSGVLSRMALDRSFDDERTKQAALAQARRFLVGPRIVSVERIHKPVTLQPF